MCEGVGKFFEVWWGGGVSWLRPISVFSLSQAEIVLEALTFQ